MRNDIGPAGNVAQKDDGEALDDGWVQVADGYITVGRTVWLRHQAGLVQHGEQPFFAVADVEIGAIVADADKNIRRAIGRVGVVKVSVCRIRLQLCPPR